MIISMRVSRTIVSTCLVAVALGATAFAWGQTPPPRQTQPPRRGGGGGTATMAIRVTDPSGAPIGGVRVRLDGPTSKESTTEGGRIAFEDLALGAYRLRFEREGFVTLERELTARAGAPMEVNVTLTPAPKPAEPVAPPAPPPPAPSAPPPNPPGSPVAINMSTFLDTNFVGRSPQKSSQLACAAGGTASLIQLNEPLSAHAHSDADEFLYVIAGEGNAKINGRDEKLRVGVFVLVPRTLTHQVSPIGRTPLVMLSIRPGETCR